MAELSVRDITAENWRDSLQLTVLPDQQRFVADHAPIAAIVLAKAYVRPGGLTWLPLAFYLDASMIGLAAVAYRPGSVDEYRVFHFFIDRASQGKGYGRQALALLLNVIRERFDLCRSVGLTVHPANARAMRLYESAGFRASGEQVDGEVVYRLTIR